MNLQEIRDDISCAKDWLLPGREVKDIEIQNCINELNELTKKIDEQIILDKEKKCDECEDIGNSGGKLCCGHLLQAGETRFIHNGNIGEKCPKDILNSKKKYTDKEFDDLMKHDDSHETPIEQIDFYPQPDTPS